MISKGVLQGLTSAEAAARFTQYGANELIREKRTSPWGLLLRQLSGPLIILLVGACVVSLALGEVIDAIAICAIIVINAIVGFLQEYRAEKAIMALRSITAPRARVIRDGKTRVIPAFEVVPEDLLVLEEGDLVAADARLVEAHHLQTNEAALTGESLPVEKSAEAGSAGQLLAEKRDQVFLGTSVTAGTGKAVVVGTGMNTELGKIAHLLTTTEETATPLQIRLTHVGQRLLQICLIIVALVAAAGWLRGRPWLEILLSSVSLAVAAVPEGLPTIVTIALALGVQRMSERNVLIRRLPSIETLGSATVICTDKTGTLTTGMMRVRELWGRDHRELLFAGTACADAELNDTGFSGTGDPTEIALLLAAREHGIAKGEIETGNPRRNVYPFDSIRKRMSIFRSDGTLYVKGAVESILPLCVSGTEGAHEANNEMASEGLRVLAIATGKTEKEDGLHLLGLVGIADPPRTEAIEAVSSARLAGIRTVMLTGDHPITARAIAREIGIGENDVHSRVTPEEKLQIVRDWKNRGEIVAMTGDGVNDAPALREAHIGIAMGKGGTEVTRETSDMILTDDNFASIIAAVVEGRGVYENIRKALVYLLAGNTSELMVMFGASVLGLPLPFLPTQLLWINLVTDGMPALALVMDPTSPDAMKRPPRRPDEPILGKPEWKTIVLIGLLESSIVLGFFWNSLVLDLDTARSLGFSALVFSQMFRALAARSSTRMFFETEVLSNVWLIAVIVITLFLQIAIHFIPITQVALHLRPLTIQEFVLSFAIGLVPVTFLETGKLLKRTISGS